MNSAFCGLSLIAIGLTALQLVTGLVIDEYFDSISSYEFVARFAFEMESLNNVYMMDKAVKNTNIDPTNVNEDSCNNPSKS